MRASADSPTPRPAPDPGTPLAGGPSPGGPDGDELTTLHVRRAVGGDDESLAWIVGRFGPLLRAQARFRIARHLAGRVDPDDLVQDVWATALPRLPRIVPRAGRYTPVLLSYLSRVLLNHYRNLLSRHLAGRPLRPGAEGEADLAARPSEETEIVQRAARGELAERVVACIEELRPADRELVVLRGIEQATNAEVACVLGLEPSTVAVRYHRALARLRAKLPRSIFDDLAEE